MVLAADRYHDRELLRRLILAFETNLGAPLDKEVLFCGRICKITASECVFITFGATFAGVLASFVLWYGGSYLIKWIEDKKVLKDIMPEILRELRLDVYILSDSEE